MNSEAMLARKEEIVEWEWSKVRSKPKMNQRRAKDQCIPPLENLYTFEQLVLKDTKTLLVFHHGQDHLHVYDIATDYWYVYDDKFEYKDYPFYSKAVTIDKTWHQYDCNDGIVACDLDEKKWFQGEVLWLHLELRGLLS
ncbi:hypothetical protein J1N35_019157 [Gossypium stocksii]|uniref:Uncharacterized protein n=1 Tax=Gossypium stocksii TaxID=47602 RepID=A0A9D4A7W1_9ROSI|nr:hypothetical protein J1N35_019157 [Gossypium stocksii]